MPDRGCGLYTLLVLALIFLTGGMIIPIVIITPYQAISLPKRLNATSLTENSPIPSPGKDIKFFIFSLPSQITKDILLIMQKGYRQTLFSTNRLHNQAPNPL